MNDMIIDLFGLGGMESTIRVNLARIRPITFQQIKNLL